MNFFRPDGSSVFRITKGVESVNGKEISWDGGKVLRMRHNAISFNDGIVATTWVPPIEGVISYTSVLSEDETEVKSIDFASYLLKSVNRGTPLNPKMELIWQEVLPDRGCHQ